MANLFFKNIFNLLSSTSRIEKERKYLENSKSFKNSQEYKNFLEFEKFIGTRDFIKIKKDKNYKGSDTFKKVKAHKKYKKSIEFQNFKKIKPAKLKEFDTWKLTFSDEFDGGKLNKKKWITKFYWGEKSIKRSYSLAGEKQFYTDGKNLAISDSMLKIITRKEPLRGRVWDSKRGILKKNFDFSSGIICSGDLFSQKYGLFEAKVKVDPKSSVYHAFWLKAPNTATEIDIFRFAHNRRNRFASLSFNGIDEVSDIKKQRFKTRGINFSKAFYIFSLEWTPEKLIWKVNNEIVIVKTQNIPHEKMFLNFNSGVIGEGIKKQEEAFMLIDWVRCYAYQQEKT